MKFIDSKLRGSMIDIAEFACAHYDISPKVLHSRTKLQDVAHIRFIVFRAFKEHLKVPLASIGAFFERDHTSIMDGIRKAKISPLSSEYAQFMAVYKKHAQPVNSLGKVGDKSTKNKSKVKIVPKVSTEKLQVVPITVTVANVDKVLSKALKAIKKARYPQYPHP